jgi:hypothetical protein
MFKPNFETELQHTGSNRKERQRMPKYLPGEVPFFETYETPDTDLSVLQSVFDDYVKKSGVSDASHATIISPERIKGLIYSVEEIDDPTFKVFAASHNSETGILSITIDDDGKTWRAIRGGERFANSPNHEQASFDKEQLEEMLTLLLLLHEQTHAFSGQDTVEPLMFKPAGNVVGFSQREEGRHLQGFFLNEGFTEYMTEKLALEYVRRLGGYKGFTAKQLQEYLELRQDSVSREDVLGMDKLEYSRETRIVKLMVKLFSDILDISEEAAEGALIRAYMRAGEIFTPELKKAFTNKNAAEQYYALVDFYKLAHPGMDVDEKSMLLSEIEDALQSYSKSE